MKRRRAQKDVLIVGAGIAGLTAAAYLSRAGHRVTVLEKSGLTGGLVQSFERDGFLFDAGPRAFGNAGILRPLAEDLDLDITLMESRVSVGIADRIFDCSSLADIDRYIGILAELFPASPTELRNIAARMRSFSRSAATLNRVDNPYFKNPWKDPAYLWGRFIPWLPAFLCVLARTGGARKSVEEELAGISGNRSLNDMVIQHFFKGTPREFALGYFFNYLDYLYTRGGTGAFPKALLAAARRGNCRVLLHAAATTLDPAAKLVRNADGDVFAYDALLWAADMTTLYSVCRVDSLPRKVRSAFMERRSVLDRCAVAESVLSVFAVVGLPPTFFSSISRGHFIYTPEPRGLGELHRSTLREMKRNFGSLDKDELWAWLAEYCRCGSYEIGIPALRDTTLAREGQTALTISTLFDGELCMMIRDRGWYGEFKERFVSNAVDALDSSIYPGLKEMLLSAECATPSSLRRLFGVRDGAIVGWSLESPAPVPDSLAAIASSVRTPLPELFLAGQWAYSPSGVPVAALTGRIAAAKISAGL